MIISSLSFKFFNPKVFSKSNSFSVIFSSKKEIFENAKHPYTQALLSAIPIPDVHLQRKEIILSGDMPSPLHPPKGCRFCTRCQYATEECSTNVPQLKGTEEHKVACFKVNN